MSERKNGIVSEQVHSKHAVSPEFFVLLQLAQSNVHGFSGASGRRFSWRRVFATAPASVCAQSSVTGSTIVALPASQRHSVHTLETLFRIHRAGNSAHAVINYSAGAGCLADQVSERVCGAGRGLLKRRYSVCSTLVSPTPLSHNRSVVGRCDRASAVLCKFVNATPRHAPRMTGVTLRILPFMNTDGKPGKQ